MSDYMRGDGRERVMAADPLRADDVCCRLSAMNAAADTAGLVAALRGLVPDLAEVAAYSPGDCLAAMRDLGMFLGSIKRHGSEPAATVPDVVPVLVELGRRSRMVPRDTVHHYTTWNPQGPRQRAYTGDRQESFLQDSVRLAAPSLDLGLELCERIRNHEPADPRFAAAMHGLADQVAATVASIDLVTENVDPAFFARTLRPYFEEVTVDGRALLGPAAAQIPLWLVDEALWASDRNEPEYQRFVEDSVHYAPPQWRGYHRAWAGRPSAISRLAQAYRDDERRAPSELGVLRSAADAAVRTLRTIVVFRGRHLRLARRAYQADVRLYPLGSGGGSVDLLGQILRLTRENAALVRASLPTGCDAGGGDDGDPHRGRRDRRPDRRAGAARSGI